MPASARSPLPARRTLALWAALAIALAAFSYLFTVALALAGVYFPFLLFSFWPPAQAAIVLVSGVVAAVVVFASLIPRRNKTRIIGCKLDPTGHPRLFSELSAIAHTLKQRVPDEVYLVADVNAAVREPGAWFGARRRQMALGLPLLRILTVSQFRAVVAHEFGHYYTGDTRLLPLVNHTRAAMARTLQSMSSDKWETTLDAFPIARIVRAAAVASLAAYWKMFMRLTLAASRRQEYRADELACHMAGSSAVIGSLRAIHGAAAVFPSFWTNELAPVLAEGYRPPIADGFAHYIAGPGLARAISDYVARSQRHATTQVYDSHPPLKDRVAAAEALAIEPAGIDEAFAITLLENVDGLEDRLLQSMNTARPAKALRPVTWEQIGPEIRLPAWRIFVRSAAAYLDRYTVATLPEALGDLQRIAAGLRDPPGTLLTREQRVERAALLVGVAATLALHGAGWELRILPGECALVLGAERITPFEVIAGLRSGAIPRDSWRQQCEKAGISDLRLAA